MANSTVVNGNGERYWSRHLIPVLVGLLIAVIGALWAMTYGGVNSRVKDLETRQTTTEVSIGRIETKVDLLLTDRGIKYRVDTNSPYDSRPE